MNVDELRPVLTAYREEVQKGWSTETAHSGYEAKSGTPAGQCGPTSLWLQKRLWLDHAVKTVFTFGSVFASPRVELRQHCWLETGEHCVLDLTADQLPGAPEVVCAYWPSTSTEHGVSYSVEMFIDDLSGHTDLLRRTALLTEAVGR
jgi:hypothetical protein